MKNYPVMVVGLVVLLVGNFAFAEQPPVQLVDSYLKSGSAETQQVAAIRQQLNAETKVAFVETPLVEIVAYLRKLHGIEIQIDQAAFEDVGLSTDVPLSLELDGVTLRSALRLLLGKVWLTYVVENGRLLITTPEASESIPVGVFYPCADLIYPAAAGDTQADYEPLIQVIEATMEPESWEAYGGSMPGIRPLENGLVIQQTEAVHDKIAALLAALRTAKSLPSDAYDPTPIVLAPTAVMGKEKLRVTLDKVISIQYEDTPLVEVAAHLSEITGVPVLINNRALEDVGKSADLPITCRFAETTLRLFLNSLASDYDLAYVVDNEVIQLTTLERAEGDLIIQVYPVRDLIYPGGDLNHQRIVNFGEGFGAGSRYVDADQPDFDALLDAITGSIEPDFWEEQGGPGVITAFADADVLVIAQTETGHQKIAQLLSEVRQHRQPRPAPSPEAIAEHAQPVLVRYPIPLDDDSNDAISKLARLLTMEVAAETWNDKTQFVQSLGKTTLLVKTSPKTHAKVRQWLAQLYPASVYAERPGWRRSGSGSASGSCYAPELFNQQPPAADENGGGFGGPGFGDGGSGGFGGGKPPKPQVMQDAVKSGM